MSILNLIEDAEAYSLTMIPSYDKNGKPKYRLNKQNPCFIGKLIKDEFYKEVFEGLPVAKLVALEEFQPVIKDLKKAYQLKSTPSLVNTLVALQDIHDAVPVLGWKAEFAALKIKHTPKATTLTMEASVPPPVIAKAVIKSSTVKQKPKVVSTPPVTI